MNQQAIDAVFKPKPSPREARADQLTRAVREMASAESAKRDAKTARLRSARLAKEAEAPIAAAPKARRKSK